MAGPATTSNSYAFSLSEADLLIEAFERLRIRPQALTHDHFISGRRSLNLELAAWSNKGVNLWGVDLITLELTANVPTYSVAKETVSILDLYLSLVDQNNTRIDRMLSPVGRDDYAAYPNKLQAGTPTVYWFDRLSTPQLYFWPAPETSVTVKYYRMRRIQDATGQMGTVPDIPYLFLEALCSGLAARLAWKYAPQNIPAAQFAMPFKAEAQQAWAEAAAENTESVPVTIRPQIRGYWRV